VGPPSGLIHDRSASLVGRDEELRAVRTALDGRGCVIAGPAGVGKTRLAADALAGLDRPNVIRVVATTSAATMPFGAVSHLLPGGDVPAIGDFIAALRDGTLGPAPTVAVDDAQWLDDASAALVLAIATTGAAPLLLTLRSHEPAPDAIVTIWRDRHLDRVDLQPLSELEVALLVESRLGAPRHARAHAWISRLAGGNPLFVTELVRDAQRTGRLEEHDGRWHLAEGRTPFERLPDLLGAHIRSVTDAGQATLELLAIGAPMPLAILEDLADTAGLEELERSRLAVVRDDPHLGPLVDLGHPLYGELVRSELPETAARRIRRDLAGALVRRGADSSADRLHVARLLLESGQVDEARFLEASRLALAHGALELGLRLAEALPPSLAAAVTRARAMTGLSRHGEVAELLEPFEAAASTAPVALATEWVETRVHGLLSGPGDQPDLAAGVLDRVAGWHDDADWRALMATARCWIAVRHRSYAAAWELVKGPLADPELSLERRRQVLLAYGLALTRLGRVDDYVALMDEVIQLTLALGGRELENGMNLVRREGGNVAAARDLAAVRERVLAQLEAVHRRGEPVEYVAALYLFAGIEHVQGHHAEARAAYERTLDLLVGADTFNFVPMVNVMLSISLAYLGEERLARRALGSAEAALAAMPGLHPWVAPDLGRARAMVEMAGGRESTAREQLLEVAATCGDDVLVASESLHVALLLGADPEHCAAGLERQARHAQDDAVHLWAGHARAVADHDPAAQLAAAEAFADAGLDLDAAQAAALAAGRYLEAGLHDGATRATALATRCAERCTGVQVPALAVRLDLPELTPREREIAVMAARGESNPAIAQALTLSVRTVETYVLRVYRKLGVNNRTALARVLGPPGPPTGR
jgi:DNA-binding CsgD family transcriptional regulator